VTSKHDKYVIECWLRLYNCLNGTTFRVHDCPDRDSSKKNVDAVCRDDAGRSLAIEHTLIQPFDGEKKDTARFMEALAPLENHPDLVLPGYLVMANQTVGAIPTGVDWTQIPEEVLKGLKSILPTLPDGVKKVKIAVSKWSAELQISKMQIGQSDPGKFLVGRRWPGDPGPELIVRALEKKVPKLSARTEEKRILLLEQDAMAGSTDSQFERLPDDPFIKRLLQLIDEVWLAMTACLRSDNAIFTWQLWPAIYVNRCSLELNTGVFRRGPR
jgi:hypothetical protein